MRVALVTHGFRVGGGVPAVSRSLVSSLGKVGDAVTIIDLATSRSDRNSRSILRPRTWARGPALRFTDSAVEVGADLVEFEVMRYRPRWRLTGLLREFDIALVVAGSPIWLGPLRDSPIPVALQVATRVGWERQSRLPSMPVYKRIPVAATTHYLGRREEAWIKQAGVVFVENQDMLSWVAGSGGRGELLPPGVDPDFFQPLSTAAERTSIVSVGRLAEPRKGWDRVIEAYSAYVQEYGDSLDLTLVGKGELSSGNRRLIERLGLGSRITVMRDVSRTELRDVLQRSRVFVQGSHEEGLGIATLEAMACGIPVVATSTSGSRQLVRPEFGRLVANDSFKPAEMAAAIEAVSGDTERMGQSARTEVLTKYTESRRSQLFRETLQRLLPAAES